MVPGLPRAARRHPDDAQRQGRPQEPARRRARRARRRDAAEPRRRGHRHREGPGRRAGRDAAAWSRSRSTATSSTTWAPNSLLLAQFCRAGPRSRPTCRRCRCGTSTCTRRSASLAARWPRRPAAAPRRRSAPRRRRRRRRTARYLLAGPLQLLLFLASLVPRRAGAGRPASSGSPRRLAFVDTSAVARCSAPATFAGAVRCCRCWPSGCSSVAGGRRRSRSGAWRYVRFWLVKTLIRANPMVLFVGSPLYMLYLRALGAKIGRGRRRPLRATCPVCTDLLTIGDGTVIRKDSSFTGYRATPAGSRPARSRSARRRSSARRRCSTSTPRSATAPSSATPRRCTPARPCRRAVLARVAGAAGPTSTTGGRRRPAAARLRRVVSACCSCSTLVVSVAARPRRHGPAVAESSRARRADAPGHDRRSTTRAFYLRGRSVSRSCCSSAACSSGSLYRVTVPRLLNACARPDTVLPALRLPLLDPADHRAHDQPQFFTTCSATAPPSSHYLRRIGYDLPPGGADRVELRYRDASTTRRT